MGSQRSSSPRSCSYLPPCCRRRLKQAAIRRSKPRDFHGWEYQRHRRLFLVVLLSSVAMAGGCVAVGRVAYQPEPSTVIELEFVR